MSGPHLQGSHRAPPAPESLRLHNVRNQLSIVVGFCDLLLAEIPEHDRKHADLLEMSKAAQTAIAPLEDTRPARRPRRRRCLRVS